MRPTPFQDLSWPQLRLLNDWDEMLADRDPQFNGRNGGWSITIALRSLASWNPGMTRADFLGAMMRKCNESTLRIQFNQSRKSSVEWFGCVLNSDGTLVEKA